MKYIVYIIIGIVLISIITLFIFIYFSPKKIDTFKNNVFDISQNPNILTKIKGDGKVGSVYIIKNFLSPAECESIINSSKNNLSKSKITRPIDDPYFRDSQTCYFSRSNPVHADIEKKICNIMGLDPRTSEDSQIQYYKKGKQFKAHYDYFDPDIKEEFEEHMKNRGQRTWTFMVYLNKVKEGGATEFINMGPTSITPETGKALIWYNLDSQGKGNPQTMHRGTPVIEGEKYIITKWFRDRIQPF
jgi:prolyl 4-hydroxylase